MRVFGWIKLVKGEEWKELKKKMPVDVIDKGFTQKYLREVLRNSRER